MRITPFGRFIGVTGLNLQNRLSMGVLATVLAATFGIATFALHLVKANLSASIASEQLERVAAIGDAIDQKFVSRRTLLRTFARSVEFQHPGDAKMQAFVDRHGALREAFDNVSFLDRAGNLVANLHGPQHVGRVNVKDRPYFIDTVASGIGVISQPIRNRVNGQPQVVMTEPIFDAHGALLYVMSGAIDLQERNFLGELADVKFGKTGYMVIRNTEGTVISHPQKSLILGTAASVGGARPGCDGVTEAPDGHGVPALHSCRHLHQTNWIVESVYPSSEAFAPVEAVERTTWLGACLLAMLAGGLTLMVLRHYLLPLTQLGEHMRVVKGARGHVPYGMTFPANEIGELARTFDELMEGRQVFQDKLASNERHLREVLAHAGDAFISIDRNGAITEWNRQAEETFGWTREQALGKDMAELLIPAHMRGAHLIGMKSFARTGRGSVVNRRIEVMALHRDGHAIPVELSVASVDMGDHYVANAFMRDITERKRVEMQLAQSERRLRMIADNMPALISHLDLDFRYTYANAHYMDWFSLNIDTPVGKTVEEVFGATAFEGVKARMAAAMAGEEVTFELTSSVQGSPSHLLVHYLPDRDETGRIIGIYGMVLDRTDRHMAQMRLAASEKRLRAVTDNLPVLISYIDHTEQVGFMNATFQRWTGIDIGRAVNRPLREVLGEELYGQRREQLSQALSGQRVEFEMESSTLGVHRNLHSIYIPDVRDDGTIDGIYTLTTDVSALKAVERNLSQLARIDPLTGLPNRRQFDERLEQAMFRGKRSKRPMALIFIDVDRFKSINDSLGHSGGDAVLVEFASRLSQTIRVTDTAARLAGDEFVVIVEGLNAIEESEVIAAKLGEVVAQPMTIEGEEIIVTCSMGVAYYTGDAVSAKELLDRADRALYKAKAAGRNTFESTRL